jgi:hypothetical protein
MPSLGFSVENKTLAPSRRTQAEIRDEGHEDNDGGFVVAMIGLGLILLAAGAYHDQARLLFLRLTAGF